MITINIFILQFAKQREQVGSMPGWLEVAH